MKKVIGILSLIFLVSCTSITKENTSLGYLVDSENNVVLALNTDVIVTTVKPKLRADLTAELQNEIFYYHKLLDGYHYYLDEDNEIIKNVKFLNDNFNKGKIEVDKTLIDAINQSIKLTKLTKGYFNPTVGNLVDVYEGKFLPYESINTDPDITLINEAIETIVPYENIEDYIIIDSFASTIELKPYNDKHYKINLGAISKGYILNQLTSSYNSSYLLNAGASSILAYNKQKEDVTWNIASKIPGSEQLLMAFTLNNESSSTSGYDEQYYLLEDGTIRHHILNPYTGYPENYYSRVTLISENAMIIDALSTAIFNIKDLNQIKEIIANTQKEYSTNIDYYLLTKNNNSLVAYLNEGFNNHLIKEYLNENVERIIR